MHPTLDRDIRIRDTRCQELPNSAQNEDISSRDLPPLLQRVLQLLEDRILQNRIYDEDEGG